VTRIKKPQKHVPSVVQTRPDLLKIIKSFIARGAPMRKCEKCHKRKKDLIWWGIMLVCQECYCELLERKREQTR